jgi:hypothetical protein
VLILLFSWMPVRCQYYFGAPTVQDCPGAIPVCQPVYSTVASYTGHGNVYPEIHNTGACPLCMDGEKNDVFYIITVQTDGILRFKLTPNNSSNDYDWSIFNMTNAECSDIYTSAVALQKSCNSYGVTGYNGPTGISSFLGNNSDCNGPGTANGPAFNKDLTVHAGETYVLNISNWSSTAQSGYTLDFTASTAVIFDNVPPSVDSIQNEVPCSGTTQLFVRFSENVKCVDVYQHPEKFTITGPGGPYTIGDVGSVTCATGATQSPSYLLVVSPKLYAGSYELNIVGDIRDLCDNIALYQSYPFQLAEINAPSAGAGNDTTVANGVFVTLHGNASGGTPGYAWHWEPAALLTNPDVQNPVTVNLGASTQFTLTVTDNAGCHAIDDVLVTIVGGPLTVNATANPQTICNGESAVLHAIGSGGSGNYNFSWTSNPPGFNSNLQDPTVFPVISTNYTVQLNDGFSTSSGSATVNVNQNPIANAGAAFSIPYGTNATLNGYATGGSGIYSWHWTSLPPGYSSFVNSPTFTNLVATTIFELVVTDLNTGCVSEPSQVICTVTGSPLAANPVSSRPVICQGESAQLFAMPGGGSGNYTYSWSSTPAGFTSTTANPFVSPLVTTNYDVVINDGFNQTNGSVNLHVDPRPVIHLGPPDTAVCVYDTVILDAGNPNSSYYWSNGAVTRTIIATTPGITYDEQHYKVKVINPYGCADSAEILVKFSFDACTGIHEQAGRPPAFRVFPNPGDGHFTLQLRNPVDKYEIFITDLLGQPVCTESRSLHKSSTSQEINLTQLPRGLYLFRVISSGNDGIIKLIIQ